MMPNNMTKPPPGPAEGQSFADFIRAAMGERSARVYAGELKVKQTRLENWLHKGVEPNADFREELLRRIAATREKSAS